MVGVQGNRLRAIELAYLEGIRAYLSHADGSSDLYKLPAIASYYQTYVLPLEGAVSEGELDDPTQQSTDSLTDPKKQTNIEIAQKQRASDQRSQSPNDPTGGTASPNNPNNPPPGNQGG